MRLSWTPKDPPDPGWLETSAKRDGQTWLYIRGQRVNPGSCSPTQGGSCPLSCSSRPENAGPPGLHTNHPGGHHCPQRLGGFLFFWEISKILQKPGCGPSPGPSCLSLPIIQFKKQPLFPRAGGDWGLQAQRWDRPCQRVAGCTPRSGNPPAQPQALQLPPPGGDSSVPPKLGGVGGCQGRLLSWDEQRFSLDLLTWEEIAGAAGFVHPWLGMCSGLGGPQNVLQYPCPP